MASVTVRYRAHLMELTGKESEVLEVNTVRDILSHLETSCGTAAKKFAKTMLIAIDGESINFSDGYATILKDGETVQFFPNCGGG